MQMCTQTTAEGQLFEILSRAEPFLMRVEELSFHGKRFTDGAFAALLLRLVAFCKNLRRLDLADCDLDPESLHMVLRCLPTFMDLRFVDLRGNPRAAGCDAEVCTHSQKAPHLLRVGLPSVALPCTGTLLLDTLHLVQDAEPITTHLKVADSLWWHEEQRRLLHQRAANLLRSELYSAFNEALQGKRLSLLQLKNSL